MGTLHEDRFFAHRPRNKSDFDYSQWNPLIRHLKNVGELAQSYAVKEMAVIAQYTGQWHDLGKYREPFQRYLRGEIPSSKDTHHAAYGALLARDLNLMSAAFAIAGHHAGLHNLSDLKNMLRNYAPDANGRTSCPRELQEIFEQEGGILPEGLTEPEFVQKAMASEDPLTQEFYIRMLFSCLTDADVSDAIRYSEGKSSLPSPRRLDHDKMIQRLDLHMQELPGGSSKLGSLRNHVHQQCTEAATQPQGFFGLTVPTGGGKTLSAMRFALEHARKHDLDRVIVVIPYLSIIEQNAAIYREIFDDAQHQNVMEHHCAAASQKDDKENNLLSSTRMADNWDSPVVVTTTVQFVESLFACSPSRCRKLHNISKSVVLLDEVHTLPHHLLDPLLSVLRQLTTHYQTTILLSTATQPAFKKSLALPHGFSEDDNVREIITDPQALFRDLSRVKFTIQEVQTSWTELSDHWHTHYRCALGIVNTRAQAKTWYRELKKRVKAEDLFHLSSSMCPEHRMEVLEKVKAKLRDPESRCYLISTQVVEAGVDIDFPVVYRASGPLDGLIQAAGRCNREGKNPKGHMVVFTPQDHALPSGTYKQATEVTANFLKDLASKTTLHEALTDPSTYRKYFDKLFPFLAQGVSTQIQKDRKQFLFRDVAAAAKVIDDEGTPVVVSYGQGAELARKLMDLLDQEKNFKKQRRKLQRYMVTLRPKELAWAKRKKLASEIIPAGPLILASKAYDPALGVCMDEEFSSSHTQAEV